MAIVNVARAFLLRRSGCWSGEFLEVGPAGGRAGCPCESRDGETDGLGAHKTWGRPGRRARGAFNHFVDLEEDWPAFFGAFSHENFLTSFA